MINGNQLRDAVISGANNIAQNKQAVDRLNVFPVPDGDTGTNMSMSIRAAANEIAALEDVSAGEVAAKVASALLRGARGNSGVILSLLFRGFAKGLKGKEEASAEDLAKALALGVESAYKAVMKPTEGTILTVARVASEKALEAVDSVKDPVEMWELICKVAYDTLQTTPEILPVLKKAGVVDAGGQGLLCVFEGMLSYFKSGIVIGGVDDNSDDGADSEPENAAGELETEITFGYCTEFIVVKENENDPLSLRAYLESIGDSVVVVDDEDIIKVHVHTNNPGKALEEGVKFGSLTKMKIENMREQHANQKPKKKTAVKTLDRVEPTEPVGFVAVAAGEGIQSLFKDLGVLHIVSGGQTMNPSTNDILQAIQATPAKTVFVLPNNKNIIMAAEQAINLADREVIVLPTKTIPQGISALLAFDPDSSNEDNRMAMLKAYERVQTGQITYAARDSEYDGHKIKEGELLCLENGKVSFTEKDMCKAAAKLTKSMLKKDSAFVTILYGEDISEEQAVEIEEAVKQKIGSDYEISLINGGQPVYYAIISVE